MVADGKEMNALVSLEREQSGVVVLMRSLLLRGGVRCCCGRSCGGFDGGRTPAS